MSAPLTLNIRSATLDGVDLGPGVLRMWPLGDLADDEFDDTLGPLANARLMPSLRNPKESE